MSEGVDKRRVRAAFDRAAAGYDAAAVLQREVGERLLERLDYMRLDPRRILEVGVGTGWGALRLAGRYPQAQLFGLDLAPAMVRAARGRFSAWERWRRSHRFLCADAERLPLADASCDLIFSNLTLQWCAGLDSAVAEFRRVLRPGGLLLFTTLGPDTLKELRAAWAAVEPAPHVNRFLDLHDVGDALLAGGLAAPVTEREDMTLTYTDTHALMRDLKTLGAHTVTDAAPRGLTGRTRLRAMAEAYERWRDAEGRLPATWEVLYGHAWVPEMSEETAGAVDGAARVGLDELRRTLPGDGR